MASDFFFLRYFNWFFADYYYPGAYENAVPASLAGLALGVPVLIAFLVLLVLHGVETWPWRFRIRSLLIAMALVASLLAFFIYFAPKGHSSNFHEEPLRSRSFL